MSKPWVEKYRPKQLHEIASQEDVVKALSTVVSDPQRAAALPHMLFHGPAGTGKTTVALALARQLFGRGDPEIYKSRVRELNASDDRGIQVIRDKVKKFAQNAVSGGSGLPPYKIIILDEADALTADAQSALRRMMEDHATTTRFILICNYVSRIIDPITSRCVKYRFRSLPRGIVIQRLKEIAVKELGVGLLHQDGGEEEEDILYGTLYDTSSGDMRNAITLLQSVLSYSQGASKDPAVLCEVLNIVPKEQLKRYLEALLSGSYTAMQGVTTDLLRQGYAAQRILTQILPMVASSEFPLTNVQRARVCLKMAECEKKLMDGADDTLQLLDFGAAVLAL